MTIELHNIVKRFGARTVVDNLDLRVEDGGFTVLLGPSGCGKTTTLRMIAGLENPDAGDIVLNGSSVARLNPKQRGVAMVFQDYGLYPHMPVLDNVSFPLKIAGVARAERERRAREMLGRLRIDHLAGQRPGRISGGEKQRVSLARALVRAPSVLLMDEPLSNLDAVLRARMRAEIKTLQQELRTTTLYVTHDQIEAMSLATAVAVMRGGRIEQYAPPEEIYRHPATLFVARFVGSPSMNTLPVRLRRDRSQVVAELRAGRVPVGDEQGRKLVAAGVEEAVLGVRPEHLGVARSGPDGGLTGAVRLVEPLGQDQYLHLAVEDQVVVARTDPEERFKVGEMLSLMPRPGFTHYFDSRSEARIG
jgi:multiple sugar transport system ATP-binding protein